MDLTPETEAAVRKIVREELSQSARSADTRVRTGGFDNPASAPSRLVELVADEVQRANPPEPPAPEPIPHHYTITLKGHPELCCRISEAVLAKIATDLRTNTGHAIYEVQSLDRKPQKLVLLLNEVIAIV